MLFFYNCFYFKTQPFISMKIDVIVGISIDITINIIVDVIKKPILKIDEKLSKP